MKTVRVIVTIEPLLHREALAEQWIGIQDITAAADGHLRDGSSSG